MAKATAVRTVQAQKGQVKDEQVKKGQVKKGRIVSQQADSRGAAIAAAKNDPVKNKPVKDNIVKLTPRQDPKKNASPLSSREQENLILKYRLKARKLAKSIMRRWNARLDMQEIESVVDLSLCEAVRRFDPKKGAGFLTYLFYHLRGNLIRAITYAATVNLVPNGELSALFSEFGSGLNSGTEDERTVKTGIAGNPNAIDIADALCSEEVLSPEEVLFRKELSSLGEDVRSKLDPLEREVIERIYLKEQQLIDIATALGYSRCHISRIKRKALDTLQEGMHDYLGELPFDMPQHANSEFDGEYQEQAERTRASSCRRPRSHLAIQTLSDLRSRPAKAA